MQRRRRGAHAPLIHAASHVDDEETAAWVFISMHACLSVPIVMLLRLAVRGFAIIVLLSFKKLPTRKTRIRQANGITLAISLQLRIADLLFENTYRLTGI